MIRAFSSFLKFSLVAALCLPACGDDHDHSHDGSVPGTPDGGVVAQTLFATEGTTLVAFDIASGRSKAGAIAKVVGPTDLQALDDGHLVVNMTDRNEVLFVDGRSFSEVARVRSSSMGGTGPVHGYLTPKLAGKQHWVVNNDGTSGMPATNSLTFIDVTPGSSTFLQAVGEIGLGIGHHKNAFSPGMARVSVSNIADCAKVVHVIDYTDAARPTIVKTWSGAELDPARDCSAQGPEPHGAAAASNGHAYHNLTGWGAILAVNQDLAQPTFRLMPTMGAGAGYTKAHKDGRYMYSLQRTPREGDATRPGADCQIGNLVVVDSQGDTLAAQVPILYTGPSCTAKLPADATMVGPDHIKITQDGKTMFVSTQGSPPPGSTAPGYSDQLVVFDLSNPAAPVQKTSVRVGSHSGHRGMALTGDGRVLLVANNNDKSVSQVDVASLLVTRTLTLREVPRQLASWGTNEGPSAQTGP